VTAAIALSIVLVIGVAGTSLAMQTQRPPQSSRPRTSRPPAPPRRPVRERRAPAPPPVPDPAPKVEPPRGPELLRIGTSAQATVLGVVDERTTGSIVRSRLNLRVEPGGEPSFEVSVRHVFSSLEARGKVRVGTRVGVRFDPDDHGRVIIAPEAQPAEPKPGSTGDDERPAGERGEDAPPEGD
jgi:hypothetical protein